MSFLRQTPDEESKTESSIFSRYDVRTMTEVMGALDNGLKHVIQAGIDRANQVSVQRTLVNL